PQQGCGGYLTDDNNTFFSPDSDSNGKYDKGLNCIWYIIAPENKLINLTFSKFLLEAAAQHGNCNYDYVQIADGRSIRSDIGGRFCGYQIPAPFISSGNFLTIQFVSDITFEREGFNATYTFVDRLCGGTYVATLTPQNASSPHLSNIRRPFSTCTWVIEAPLHKQIKITVWELRLTSQDCSHNYLELQDSPQSNGPVTQFCAANFTTLPTFYSSKRTATVVFRSEVLNTNSRVHFTYQIADCNREYNQAFGTLTSPGWPQAYDNNLDCTIILRAPQNNTISLFFYWFELEDSRQCTRDFLEVRNGNNSGSPLLHKYCGTLLPNPIFSQSNELYLWFKSDDSGTADGYEIVWTSSPSGCGGTLFSDNGILTNPGYPDSYSNNTHCEWNIIAPSGRPVTIRFPLVNINPPGDCAHNYLTLYNGPDDSSPPFGIYCGINMSKSLKKLVEESREKNQPEVDMSDRGISSMLDVNGLFSLAHITQLVLSHNKLTTVPPNVAELKNLEVLNFFNNQIEELPTQISSLQKLKHLNLGMNRLNTLPRGFGSLPALEVLDLTYNNLNEHSLPGNFFYLTTLRALYLSDNDFETLPPDIGKLTKLQILSLRDNDLISLPKEIGELTQLKELHIQGNRLTVLPPELAVGAVLTERADWKPEKQM
ncbi:hypothetical protein STEG23_019742, partial [Scotinomys teguina]